MIGWVALYVAFVAVARWVLAWCRHGVDEIGRDMRRLLIAQARADEES